MRNAKLADEILSHTYDGLRHALMKAAELAGAMEYYRTAIAAYAPRPEEADIEAALVEWHPPYRRHAVKLRKMWVKYRASLDALEANEQAANDVVLDLVLERRRRREAVRERHRRAAARPDDAQGER